VSKEVGDNQILAAQSRMIFNKTQF